MRSLLSLSSYITSPVSVIVSPVAKSLRRSASFGACNVVVRICVVMGTLLRSGIVFVRAVQIAQRTTSNLVLRDALAAAEKATAAGADIGQAIERTGAFPPMVVQIFAVGQQSGRLEEMLERLGETYDQQVNQTAQRLTAVLEPVMIVLLALVVLFIVLATVLPILEAGNAIQ